MKNNRGLIIFDLDNTLVDKNAVFEKAQKRMIEIIKGSKATEKDMNILRKMDSVLIKKKGGHLYPFEILALSLWFHYCKKVGIEKSVFESLHVFNSSVTSKEIEEAVNRAKEAASAHNHILENAPAELFDGVKAVLRELKERGYTMVLLSEASESLQKKTLETHSLKQYFDDVVLCNRKTRKCFMDIKNRWNGDENGRFFVVGDGIKRDIEPGNKAGAVTVWTPGDFDPGTPGPGSKRPDYSIKDIGDILTIIR